MSTVTAGEIGTEARAAISAMTRDRVAGKPVAGYVQESPMSWAALADGGWDHLGVPEAEGGAGAAVRDLAEVALAWGESLIPLPLIPSLMAKRWSPEARDHAGPVSFAVPTPSTPGRSTVPFGAEPGLVVLSRTGEGAGLLGRDALGDVEADDYAPSLRMVTTAATTEWDAERRGEVVVLWAAECTGAATRVLRDTVDYVRQREQFGRPVGSFQAVKHHLADAHILVQEAESAVIWGALEPDRAHQAGILAMDNAARVIEIGIQAHGGLGFTWEMGLHIYLRHTVALRDLSLALRS